MSLVSIGEFAQASRLSPKALRLYDEFGLLVPAHVDPDTGYRWYSLGQLDRARLVASLRRIAVPLARIKEILALEPTAAVAELAAYWSGAEAEHAARRELVGHLVDELSGKRSEMHEVEVRELPERRLLSLILRMHQEELLSKSRELFLGRVGEAGVPRIEGSAGAPFLIFHGEVSGDSDGPVEWCWPVPQDRAEEFAAGLPGLTLRTEPAHQEAFVRQQGPAAVASGAQAELALRALAEWATRRQRQANGAVRMVFVPNPANGNAGPDGEYAVPLRPDSTG